ncbi:hypothetical protein Tco_0051881 [Tanacetum coccineum]
MSSSTVTYTSISSNSDLPPWGFHLMDPAEFEAPPSPDYVPGPEHPPSPDYVHGPEEPEQASLSPDYVPKPEYPEYLVPSDAEAPIEDQLDDASPTALSPGYVADFDPEEDLKEDPEEDHANYPADGGDDDDNDDDDEKEDEEDEEEEEHLALADSTIPSTPLPLPSPPTHTSLTYAEAPLSYRAVRIQLRAASLSTHHPSKIPSSPLLLPSTTHRDDLPKADMSLQKRARFTAPTSRFEVGECSLAAARQTRHTLAHRVDYGFIDTMDASICASESRAMTAVGVVNERVTNLATTQRHDTHELQVRYEDAQDDQALLGAQVSLLIIERRYFYSMASSYEREAFIARQAWSHSENRIQAMKAQIRALQRDVDEL